MQADLEDLMDLIHMSQNISVTRKCLFYSALKLTVIKHMLICNLLLLESERRILWIERNVVLERLYDFLIHRLSLYIHFCSRMSLKYGLTSGQYTFDVAYC